MKRYLKSSELISLSDKVRAAREPDTLDKSSLYNICQSIADDMESDHGNDTLDTLYETFISNVEYELGRSVSDQESDLIFRWLQKGEIEFPDEDYEEYDDDDQYDPNL